MYYYYDSIESNEREEQMRAQIASLSCEISFNVIRTAVETLVDYKFI
jgi:hypothetical protein